MLVILTLTAGTVLWPSFGYVHSSDEGCFVKDVLYFDDPLNRSVKFSAFTPPSGIIFKAKVKCRKGDYAADFFNVSNNEVTMMRYNDYLTKTKGCWSGPKIEAGWTDFDLQFGDAYQIVDGQGQSRITERISPKCSVKEVVIRNGSFITQCSEGMAKWEVLGGQCAFVPLFLSEGENLLNLTLTSRDKFRPVFHFSEQKVELGMKNEAFVVSENGMSALPPSSQIVVLLFDQNDDFISCAVKPDGQEIAKINLKREPRHVKVCSEENTEFLLTLPMKMTIDVDEDFARCTDYKFWILFGGLVLTISTAAVCIFLYCHHKCQKNSQGSSSREPPQAAPESLYLEPRAIQRMESPDSSVSPSSSSEHIYEEVDEMDFGQINENTKV